MIFYVKATAFASASCIISQAMRCEGGSGLKSKENTGLAMTPSGYNITTHSILSLLQNQHRDSS